MLSFSIVSIKCAPVPNKINADTIKTTSAPSKFDVIKAAKTIKAKAVNINVTPKIIVP